MTALLMTASDSPPVIGWSMQKMCWELGQPSTAKERVDVGGLAAADYTRINYSVIGKKPAASGKTKKKVSSNRGTNRFRQHKEIIILEEDEMGIIR
jgi:hypothetical protein